jgi:hypothetical protein
MSNLVLLFILNDGLLRVFVTVSSVPVQAYSSDRIAFASASNHQHVAVLH